MPTFDLSAANLPMVRAGIEAQLAELPTPDLPVVLETIDVPATARTPALRVFAYRPMNASSVLPAILHIHGGGYVVGSPKMMDNAHRQTVADLGCALFAVEYRLAPESPFPAAIEDCYAALAWLHANAMVLAIDPARLGVMGESAGGGLAASLALLTRDRGQVPLAFQHLIYPAIDDRTCLLPDPHPFTGEFIWTRASNIFGWSSLLGAPPGGADVSIYAAAARAMDLAGLPPAYIAVGALDLFLEENLDYARRLTRAGVPVELHVYPGAVHGFQQALTARTSIAAESHSRNALRRALYG
ncbi:MAG: alpha/beta hydrolase [Acidocella sp.]|nr:alpha/beta hydrolase [Acidocella sp.]